MGDFVGLFLFVCFCSLYFHGHFFFFSDFVRSGFVDSCFFVLFVGGFMTFSIRVHSLDCFFRVRAFFFFTYVVRSRFVESSFCFVRGWFRDLFYSCS